WLKRHFEGGYLVRKLVIVEASRDDTQAAGWRITYGFQNLTPNDTSIVAPTTFDGTTLSFTIPIQSPQNEKPSFDGNLRIEMRGWSEERVRSRYGPSSLSHGRSTRVLIDRLPSEDAQPTHRRHEQPACRGKGNGRG